MKSYLPKRFDFRVRVFMEEPDFGKGVAQLLSLTREKGSLSAAYKSMGMAESMEDLKSCGSRPWSQISRTKIRRKARGRFTPYTRRRRYSESL